MRDYYYYYLKPYIIIVQKSLWDILLAEIFVSVYLWVLSLDSAAIKSEAVATIYNVARDKSKTHPGHRSNGETSGCPLCVFY